MTTDDDRVGLLVLAPTFVRRVWGGGRLPGMLGVHPPEGTELDAEPVAEAWLASRDSVVASGRWRGRSLADLIRERPTDLLGEASVRRYGPLLPLWVKFLDARDDLSIQVHPNDAQAAAAHAASGDLGKTESWVILDAVPGASVTWGTVATTPDEVRTAIDEGRLSDLLRRHAVHPGDVVHNPAGTVHAVHAGLTIYELQQASDVTYRLWDYGRLGADGRPRELHVEASLDVANLGGTGSPFPPPPTVDGRWTTWVDCPPYVMDETTVEARGGVDGHANGKAFHLLTVVEGTVTCSLVGVDDEPVTMTVGTTVFVPACAGRYVLTGAGRVVRGRPNEQSGAVDDAAVVGGGLR